MKMPALMTPKNAVTTSNMVLIPDPAIRPNALQARTVKRIQPRSRISKLNDDFEQQTGARASVKRRYRRRNDWFTTNKLSQSSPHFRRVPTAICSPLDAEVGCVGTCNRRTLLKARRVGVQLTEWYLG
jgi:hypothetical protein